jgi:hypothetical protein
MNKIESANQLNTFLNGVVKHAGLKLKYRISVDPPIADDRDWERPEILVEFAGPDSSLLRRTAAVDGVAGYGNVAPSRQRARKNQLRLHGPQKRAN